VGGKEKAIDRETGREIDRTQRGAERERDINTVEGRERERGRDKERERQEGRESGRGRERERYTEGGRYRTGDRGDLLKTPSALNASAG
jgi:hypothetical protein